MKIVTKKVNYSIFQFPFDEDPEDELFEYNEIKEDKKLFDFLGHGRQKKPILTKSVSMCDQRDPGSILNIINPSVNQTRKSKNCLSNDREKSKGSTLCNEQK